MKGLFTICESKVLFISTIVIILIYISLCFYLLTIQVDFNCDYFSLSLKVLDFRITEK